ncbi:hypothetical protein HMPREF9061_01033 [Actinomyces sp. oral taxon 181 str. F0379]|nr:hypothetical protein HMPREF9061_01033 [Actinomyces sp. oral taxon 181 str. F0379]
MQGKKRGHLNDAPFTYALRSATDSLSLKPRLVFTGCAARG